MRKTISVIIPIYNEEENLPVLYERLGELAEKSDHDFEFIFVDDGSSDSSFIKLKEMSTKDSRIAIIRFTRNFGSHAACLAGLTHAKGDACTFMSADMQDPPELIPELTEQWMNGFDTVLGVRERGTKSGRLLPNIYWKLVKRFALPNMPETGTDVFLIDRKVADTVISMGVKNTSIFGLILWSGFKQTSVTYKKMPRNKGKTKWTVGKKIKLFVDTFVSFSYFPIRTITVIGIIFALLGFSYAFFIIVLRLFFNVPVEGWSSLMVVLLVISGVQLTMLGILGEYLWRNFDETRNRPPFIIGEKVGFSNKAQIQEE